MRRVVGAEDGVLVDREAVELVDEVVGGDGRVGAVAGRDPAQVRPGVRADGRDAVAGARPGGDVGEPARAPQVHDVEDDPQPRGTGALDGRVERGERRRVERAAGGLHEVPVEDEPHGGEALGADLRVALGRPRPPRLALPHRDDVHADERDRPARRGHERVRPRRVQRRGRVGCGGGARGGARPRHERDGRRASRAAGTPMEPAMARRPGTAIQRTSEARVPVVLPSDGLDR